MKCNMGTIDRYIRTTAGVLLLIYAVINFDIFIVIPIMIIGYTVSTRWCILYHFLGINTGCHLKDDTSQKGTRNNIVEGLAISLALLLILLTVYLIVIYAST